MTLRCGPAPGTAMYSKMQALRERQVKEYGMSWNNALPLEVWEKIWCRERNPQGYDAFRNMVEFITGEKQ